MRRPLCTRHDRPRTDDADLLGIVATAEARLGRPLSGSLIVLSDHDGQLLATWRDATARAECANALSHAWSDAGGATRPLHLVASDDDYDYQEDAVDEADG